MEVPLFLAAQRLHVTPERARRLVAVGLLIGVLRGNRLFVQEASLDRYLRTVGADTPNLQPEAPAA